MKIIKPNFEIIDQQAGIDGLLKHIEFACGECCKPEDGHIERSLKAFADRMIESGNGSKLEHVTVYLATTDHLNPWRAAEYGIDRSSRVERAEQGLPVSETTLYITTNFRVLVERHRLDDLKFICAPTDFHRKRVTVRFMCDWVAKESFGFFPSESTGSRLSSKGMSDAGLHFVRPPMFDDEVWEGHEFWWGDTYDDAFLEMCGEFAHRESSEFDALDIWYFHLLSSRWCYQQLIKRVWSPEQASRVLPMDIASPFVVTAYVDDWKRFFDLHGNSSENSGSKELIIPLRDEFVNRGLLES